MADNVAITAGSGTAIATDDVSSVHYQKVKVDAGGDGVSVPVVAGQQLMAASVPVVLASNQTDVKVSLDSEAVVLGAGSAAIGKLAANSGVDIGDVDVLSISAGDNNIGNVDIVTVPAPLNVVGNGAAATALRVSLANDSTGIVALTTSSAAIGKLAANSGVDIGDVDVTSVVPGTGATALGKAEDAGHSSGDVGVMALAVRQDALAASAGTDGDYIPLTTDALGRLRMLSTPLEHALTIVTGTAASAGDNVLISAPGASTCIVVVSFEIQNESATATTMILKDDSTAKFRNLAQNQGDGLSKTFPPDARWKLTANKALNLNLSGANSCGYNVTYYTEAG